MTPDWFPRPHRRRCEESPPSSDLPVFRRVLRHLSPRGLVLLLIGLIWVDIGVGTLDGYSGTPREAPHLLIPPAVRGVMWVLSGLLALTVAVAGRRHLHRYGVAAAMVPAMMRALSYTATWVLWLLGMGGSPAGYYTAGPWWMAVVVVLGAMFAPTTWGYMRRVGADEERDRHRART